MSASHTAGPICTTDRGTVSQATNISTAVTLDRASGTITTQAANAAAGDEHTFTVNNSLVRATDVPLVAIATYAGAGTPYAVVDRVAAGSFRIGITNVHTADALNAAMTINFIILGAGAAAEA